MESRQQLIDAVSFHNASMSDPEGGASNAEREGTVFDLVTLIASLLRAIDFATQSQAREFLIVHDKMPECSIKVSFQEAMKHLEETAGAAREYLAEQGAELLESPDPDGWTSMP